MHTSNMCLRVRLVCTNWSTFLYHKAWLTHTHTHACTYTQIRHFTASVDLMSFQRQCHQSKKKKTVKVTTTAITMRQNHRDYFIRIYQIFERKPLAQKDYKFCWIDKIAYVFWHSTNFDECDCVCVCVSVLTVELTDTQIDKDKEYPIFSAFYDTFVCTLIISRFIHRK